MFVAGDSYPQSLSQVRQASGGFIVASASLSVLSPRPVLSWKPRRETIFDRTNTIVAPVIDNKIQIVVPSDISAISTIEIKGVGKIEAVLPPLLPIARAVLSRRRTALLFAPSIKGNKTSVSGSKFNNGTIVVQKRQQKSLYSYSFDAKTRTITIIPTDPNKTIPQSQLIVKWHGISDAAPSGIGLINCVAPPYPEILGQWNIKRVSISRQLGESPSASIEFDTCFNDELAVRKRFKLGALVNLFQIPLRVSQWQIVRSGTHIYPTHKTAVSVSLEWYLSETFKDSPLNKSPAVAATYSTKQAKVTVPTKTKRVDVFTVIGRQPGRANVVGSAVVEREVPVSGTPPRVDTATYSTVGEALTDGAARSGSFLFKSGSAIASIPWGQVPTHFISLAEITTDLTFVLQKQDGDIDEEDDEEKEPEEEEEPEEEKEPPPPDRDKEEIVETERFEYENCLNAGELVLPYYYGDEDASRTTSICFDSGGPTKKERIIKEKAGVMLETTEEVWGYAFISKEAHSYYPDRNPPDIKFLGATGWRKVQETRTKNYFDRDGYLVKTETTGWKLARLKQESGTETASLYLDALIYGTDTEEGEANLKEIRAYLFSLTFPIYDVTTYKVESMRNYYRDIVRPSLSSDPFWVEPKFASVVARKQVDRIVAENPNSDETVNLPPIVVIQELIEETKTVITNTKSTPERFCVIQYSNAGEGAGGRNRIIVTSNQENLGRPSTHTTVPVNRIFWQDLVEIPKEPEDEKTEEETEEEEKEVQEILETTISAARNETLSFSMLYRPEFKEGDKVYFDGKYWVILDINAEFRCELKRVVCENFSLTLGKFTAI